MNRFILAALACASLPAYAAPATAHAIAGARVFPVTLTIDDPGVADEASLPTFSAQRAGADGGPGAVHTYTISGEYNKRITERLGIGIAGGYAVQDTLNDKTRGGFADIVVTPKFQAYVNAEHEFIVSVGVIREFGRTGTIHTGADIYGSTTPKVYYGKGLGDLPIGLFRPLAVTGTAAFSIADRELKGRQPPSNLGAQAGSPILGLPATLFNNGYSNRWVGGLSVQYSIPYLQAQVHDYRLPDLIGRLTPIVELAYSSPASSPSNLGTQLVFAPGVIYSADAFQFGVEALVPVNRASGRNVGVVAQFHVFFDDIFPNSLGKPLFDF